MDRALVDTFAHRNPAFGACCLHWMATGYQEQLAPAEGRLSFLWAILGMGLLAPRRIRESMYSNANGKLALFLDEHPEVKAAAAGVIRAWAEPFWDAARLGVATGSITLEQGRLSPNGRLKAPTTSDAKDLRRRAVAFGKILGKERDDAAIASLLGLAVVP